MSDPQPKRITFKADGRRIEARDGQSIAAALWAHGDRALSRSMKYHRPRGWSCGIGRCNDCAMRVDGEPNVKTCVTPARDGMVVEGQNAWPSVRRDVFRANDLAFYKGLDHHTSFVKPRFLYPLFTKVMRGFAGWGKMPDAAQDAPHAEALRPEVLVVGAGPAGLAAAHAAADAGAAVLVLEERGVLGGHATRLGQTLIDPDAEPTPNTTTDQHDVTPATLLTRWTKAVTHHPRIEVRTGTALAATYPNGLMIAESDDHIIAMRPSATIIATGGLAAMASFEQNDLPGIMTAAGAQALLHEHGVRPGKRAVVYGAGSHGCHVAMDLDAAGVDVAAIIEPGPAPSAPSGVVAAVEASGIPIRTESRITRADGLGKVKRVRIQTPSSTSRIKADTVVVALGHKTAPEPFQSVGCALRYEPEAGGAVPVLSDVLETDRSGWFACGDAAGIGSLATARASGTLAGLAAARHVGHGIDARSLVAQQERLRALSTTHGGPSVDDATTRRAAQEVPA